MNRFMRALLGLAGQGVVFTYNTAHELYRALVWVAVGLLIPIAIGFALNAVGLLPANLVLVLVVSAGMVFLWLHPMGFVGAMSFGLVGNIIRRDRTLTANLEALIEEYYLPFLKTALFIEMTFLSFLGFVPLEGNGLAFLLFSAFGLTTLAFAWQFGYEVEFAKKWGFRLSFAVALVSFVLLIGPVTFTSPLAKSFYGWVGFNPIPLFKTSKVEKKKQEIQDLLMVGEDEVEARRLDGIKKELERQMKAGMKPHLHPDVRKELEPVPHPSVVERISKAFRKGRADESPPLATAKVLPEAYRMPVVSLSSVPKDGTEVERTILRGQWGEVGVPVGYNIRYDTSENCLGVWDKDGPHVLRDGNDPSCVLEGAEVVGSRLDGARSPFLRFTAVGRNAEVTIKVALEKI